MRWIGTAPFAICYAVSVAFFTTSVTVTPTAAGVNATITVNGSAVTSGSASQSISLEVGENTITTIVTAEDGTTTKTYTVVATRANVSVSHFVGPLGGAGRQDGAGTAARFGSTLHMTYTGSALFVTDENNNVRKLE